MRAATEQNDAACANLAENMDQSTCGTMGADVTDISPPQCRGNESSGVASGETGGDPLDKPVIFEEDEYELLPTHVDEKMRPIPHDLIRFDCTELGNPPGEILYETDEWTGRKPVGGKAWVIPQVPSGEVMEVGRFPQAENETGYRATYSHSGMMNIMVSSEESYFHAEQELGLQ